MSDSRPPSDTRAEASVVAALICQPSLMRYCQTLTADHFTDPECRQVFGQMVDNHNEGRIWLAEDFAGFRGLAHPFDTYEPMFDERLKRIQEAHVSRSGLQVASQLARAAYKHDNKTMASVLAEARLPGLNGNYHSPRDLASALFDQVGEGRDDIVPTGLRPLDRIGILRKSELMVLAARPSMGKSQLAFQIAYHVANQGGTVVVASLEMAAHQVITRIAQALCGYSMRDTSSPAQGALATTYSNLMDARGIYIYDHPMTSLELWGYARAIASETGRLDLIVSDHVRLFKDEHEAERHRLGLITVHHRDMAHEFNCPVLLLAQLSRASEYRTEKKPGLIDLRDSGEIEENTDVAAFLYRDAYYERIKKGGDQSGIAELYAAKNRNGELWASQMYFDAKRGPRFAAMQHENDGAEQIPFTDDN